MAARYVCCLLSHRPLSEKNKSLGSVQIRCMSLRTVRSGKMMAGNGKDISSPALNLERCYSTKNFHQRNYSPAKNLDTRANRRRSGSLGAPKVAPAKKASKIGTA